MSAKHLKISQNDSSDEETQYDIHVSKKQRIMMTYKYNKKIEKKSCSKTVHIIPHILFILLIILELAVTNIYSPTYFPLFTTTISANNDFLLFICLFIAYYTILVLIWIGYVCYISYNAKKINLDYFLTFFASFGLLISLIIPLCFFCFSPCLLLYGLVWILLNRIIDKDIEWCIDTTFPLIDFAVYKIAQSPTLGKVLKLISQHLIACILCPDYNNKCFCKLIELMRYDVNDDILDEYNEDINHIMLFKIYNCKTTIIWFKLCRYRYLMMLIILYLVVITIFFLCLMYSEFYKDILLEYYVIIYPLSLWFCLLIILISLIEQISELNKFRWMLPIFFHNDNINTNLNKITTKWSQRKFYKLFVNILEKYLRFICLLQLIKHKWMIDVILYYVDIPINGEMIDKSIKDCYVLESGRQSNYFEAKMFILMDEYEKNYAGCHYEPRWYLQYLSNCAAVQYTDNNESVYE